MERTVLIRVGEIFLKGNNRRFFDNILKDNIKNALKNINCKLAYAHNRTFVTEYAEEDERSICDCLTKVFGIYSISPAIKIQTDLSAIANLACTISPKKGKFRVTVNRADKRVPKKSMDIAAFIGEEMLNNSKDLSVDLFNYDFELCVDIRENGYSYIFYDRIQGQGGLPVTCGGRGMLLLSGGIDSPVAGYKMAKRGVKLFAVHYHSYPYTSELAKEKVLTLAKKLSEYAGEIEVLVVPFTEIQYAIKMNCPIEFMITIMRRFMMRIAERLAKLKSCGAIITGESLGQVASQTMESINVTNSVVTMPVFRPLIGDDKEEIVEISKKIDTYDTSILPYEDCCTVFLPKNPVIHPKLNIVLELEKKLNIEELILDAIDRTEKIICG